jgi:Fe-S cluster biogenesis protein NfuA
MAGPNDARAVGRRVEALLEELATIGDAHARARTEDLVRSLMELYGAGLTRLLEIVDEDDEAAARLFERFADDGLVASLMILHGLHPLGTEARVAQAIERVRPYLGSHGGGVQLLGVTDGVALLKLEGSCDGCPSSALTVRQAIERAIEEAAPEVTRVAVEGASEPPRPSPLLQITTRSGRPRPESETSTPAVTT